MQTDDFGKGKHAYQKGNYTEAITFYKIAAEDGNAGVQYSLGLMYEKGRGVAQDYKQAVEWYIKAAEQGDANAQKTLSLMDANGQKLEQEQK